MAEPTTFPEEHVAEPLVYRRLSLLAIFSFAVAVLFTLTLLLITVWALRDRTPIFIPLLLLGVPLFAAGMGGAALVAIRRSQGSLAGAVFARVGLWLSLITLLAYCAYFGATYGATLQQSNAFVLRWIQEVRRREMGKAILDTQDPRIRQTINPDDEKELNIRLSAGGQGTGAAVIDNFLRTNIIQILNEGTDDAKIEPDSVNDWDYQKEAFRIARTYKVVTLQGVFDIKIVTVGATSRTHEWDGRQWKLSLPECSLGKAQMTRFGLNLNEVRNQCAKFLESWGYSLLHGDLAKTYLASLSPEQEAQRGKNYLLRLLMGGMSAGPGGLIGSPIVTLAALGESCQTGLSRDLYLSGYRDSLGDGKLFNQEKFAVEPDDIRPVVQPLLNDILAGRTDDYISQGLTLKPISRRATWKYQNGVLELPFDVTLAVRPKTNLPKPAAYAIDGVITVETAVDLNDVPPTDLVFRMKSLELLLAEDEGRYNERQAGIRRMRMPLEGGGVTSPGAAR
jgi:hypothetical protein